MFNPSDSNWVLAASGFWTAFIGGAHADLPAALGYRSRQLLLPLSTEDKEKAREAADLVYEAKTPRLERKAIAALKAAHLAQADFEITDYDLGTSEPPVGVEWVRFNVSMTLPRDFAIGGDLPVLLVELRAGEIRGLTWDAYNPGDETSPGSIRVLRSVWRGRVIEPKTPRSKAAVPLIPQLQIMLERHRAAMGNSAEGPIFENGAGNGIDLDSLYRNHMKEPLRKA